MFFWGTIWIPLSFMVLCMFEFYYKWLGRLQSVLNNLVWINTNSIPMVNKTSHRIAWFFSSFFSAVRKKLEFWSTRDILAGLEGESCRFMERATGQGMQGSPGQPPAPSLQGHSCPPQAYNGKWQNFSDSPGGWCGGVGTRGSLASD